mmetsp:Transcript_54882/g.151974  ORF Transcript_54882/g.151974 Transcript_54882/m.151974 type:complete len:220 (+) Transcript_54882:296-955(+)
MRRCKTGRAVCLRGLPPPCGAPRRLALAEPPPVAPGRQRFAGLEEPRRQPLVRGHRGGDRRPGPRRQGPHPGGALVEGRRLAALRGQGRDDLADGLAQRGGGVAALEGEEQPPMAELRGEAPQLQADGAEEARRDARATDGVPLGRVEARAHEDEVRKEAARCGQQHLGADRPESGVAVAHWKRDVDGEAGAAAFTDLFAPARAWEEALVLSVRADEEH